jgi:hypothetical protein
MNPVTSNTRPVWHVGLGFLEAALLFAALFMVVRHSVSVPTIDADRAALRTKDLMEIRTNAEQELNHVGWIDQQRGIVRLPISLAMKLAAQEWQNPAEARTNLIAREAKASKPLPKPAAKPNPFE